MSELVPLSMAATLLTAEGEQIEITGKALDADEAHHKIVDRLITPPGQAGWREKLVGARIMEITVAQDNPSGNIFSRDF